MIKRCKFIVLLTYVILMGCDESIDYRQTKNINGLYYKIGANSPLSGWITNISLNIPGAATLAKCDISVKN